MTDIHAEDRQLPQRPKTDKASELEATYVRNAGQLKASLDPYRWGSKDCKKIIETLIGALRPARHGSEESRKYRYFTDGVVHWAIGPRKDAHGLLKFSLYQCEEGGILQKVKKGKTQPPDKRLAAPDLLAFFQGGDVPLSSALRGQWKRDLERAAFGECNANIFQENDIPFTPIEHPDFLYEKGTFGPVYRNEYGDPIEGRKFWRQINEGLERKVQRRRALKIYEIANWFQNEWRMGAKNGFPCVIEASDGYLAKALGMTTATAREIREVLEQFGIIAKAYQYDSDTGSRHFGYLPGPGPEATLSYPVRTEEPEDSYIRPLSVLRRYRVAFGLLYPKEWELMKRRERESEREDLF